MKKYGETCSAIFLNLKDIIKNFVFDNISLMKKIDY